MKSNNYLIYLKKFLRLLNPEIYRDKEISKWDLCFRATKTADAICERSTYFDFQKELLKQGLLIDNPNNKTFNLSEAAWILRNKILEEEINPLPQLIADQVNEVLEKVRDIEIFSQNSQDLWKWTESFSICTQRFFSAVHKISLENQNKFLLAIALVNWNTFYQLKLIKTDDFLNIIDMNESVEQIQLYLVSEFFGWKYFTLDNCFWFISKDYEFLESRLLDLTRYFVYRKYPTLDFGEEITTIKEFIDNNELKLKRLLGKATQSLIKEILAQEGHNWSDKDKENKKFISERLSAMDFIRIE